MQISDDGLIVGRMSIPSEVPRLSHQTTASFVYDGDAMVSAYCDGDVSTYYDGVADDV